MLAKKLLANHEIEQEHEDDVIKFLCSESGSHDYTMHRKEAKNLGLNIEKPNMELYTCIKSIYDDIEKELAKMENYNFLFKQVCISYRFYPFFPDSIQIRWASCRISLSARNFPGI